MFSFTLLIVVCEKHHFLFIIAYGHSVLTAHIPLKVNSEETHCLSDPVAYEYSNELVFLKIQLKRNMQDQRGILQHKTIQNLQSGL